VELVVVVVVVVMLRKVTSTGSTSLSEQYANNNVEDGEKGSKIRRQQQSRFKGVIAFLGIMGMLVLVTMVKRNHNQKFTPSSLRSSRRARSLNDHKKDPHGLELIDPAGFRNPNSIYSLSVQDITGTLASLEKFHGMVTLIVNVACS
jgi:preprotein translocase subunit SecG